MIAFASHSARGATVRERAQHLYEALLATVRLDERTDHAARPRGSRSVRDVFEQRLESSGERYANGLEMSLLYLALARSLGLSAIAARQKTALGSSRAHQYGHVVVAVQDTDALAGPDDDGEGAWRLVDLTQQRFWSSLDGFAPILDERLMAYWWHASAVVFRGQGRLRQAERAATRALALEPHYGTFWHHRGSVRMLLGDMAGAEADFERAATILPELPRVRVLPRRGPQRAEQPLAAHQEDAC
jgi:tetratricopeptide (TPR) repeat protein